jgi:chromosome segregation ATPase
MAKLDQLEKEVLKAQDKIDQLREKQTKAENAVMSDPDNEKAALNAAAAEMQLRAAEKAKRQALEAVQAEKRRLHELQRQAVQDQMADLEKQVDALREKNTTQALAFFEDYKAWHALILTYEGLAQRHGIKGRDLRNLDKIHGGMNDLNAALREWKNQKDLVDYRRQNHGG